MTRRGILTAILGGAASLTLLGGCSLLFPARYRFRITVMVDTPQGVKSGSSVFEASAGEQPIQIGDYGSKQVTLRGEAVAVDLPSSQTLFALIDDRWPGVIARLFIPDLDNAPKPFVQGFARLGSKAMRGRSVELRRDKYPKLVRFRDRHDPRSVEAVDSDNLAASFGPGVRLKRIVVQLTNDSVTTGIERRLEWLDHLDSYRSDPSNPFTDHLPTEVGSLRSSAR